MEFEDIIVLNNVTKFHKILIKIIQLREGTGVTLNAPAIVMAGA